MDLSLIASARIPKRWRFVDQPLAFQFFASGGLVLGSFAVSLFVLLPRLREFFFAGIALHLLLLLVSGYALIRLYFSIARPIADLSDAMEQYERGDLRVRVEVTQRNEIGHVAASFNEMAEKIEAMVGDYKRLDEMKSEFISTVSHELRTPLTAIGGYTQLLVQQDAGEVNEIQKEFLSIIDTNVKRLTELINDILDVEKMEAGKIELGRERLDLVSILRECCDTFSVTASQKKLELRLKSSDGGTPGELWVQGDRARLVQLFMNLISNAVKYTSRGFVEIEVEQNFAGIVRVRDSGIGMNADEQEKLFQKFYRTHSAVMSNERGTGLGLVIAKGIVEAHGGSISVSSREGEGTCFQITLPLASASAEAPGAPGANELQEDSHALDGVRILLVDGNSDLRLLVRRSLERRGAIVDDVDRGKEALRRVAQEDYNLILVDLNLPDMSGLELIKAAKRRFSLKRPAVFVMLDEGKSPPSRQQLLQIGADQFVGKLQGIGGIADAVQLFWEGRGK